MCGSVFKYWKPSEHSNLIGLLIQYIHFIEKNHCFKVGLHNETAVAAEKDERRRDSCIVRVAPRKSQGLHDNDDALDLPELENAQCNCEVSKIWNGHWRWCGVNQLTGSYSIVKSNQFFPSKYIRQSCKHLLLNEVAPHFPQCQLDSDI